ncbi:MAG: type II secretion system F family protein [Actinomycetota bacterium]
MALVLGGAWAGLVLLALVPRRPPPPRVRALAGRARPGRRRLLPGSLGSSRAGAAVLAALLVLAGVAVLAPAPLLAAWAAPRHRRRAAERRRLHALEAGLPEVVDLLVLAVGAGCNVPLAVAAAGRRAGGPVAAELRRVSADVARGRRLADALDELPSLAGEPTRPLAAVLSACERYGTPVLPALDRLASEVRVQRQRRAEAAARRVPVALLFPLVLCILPAFALLTVAPLVAGALRELRL